MLLYFDDFQMVDLWLLIYLTSYTRATLVICNQLSRIIEFQNSQSTVSFTAIKEKKTVCNLFFRYYFVSFTFQNLFLCLKKYTLKLRYTAQETVFYIYLICL